MMKFSYLYLINIGLGLVYGSPIDIEPVSATSVSPIRRQAAAITSDSPIAKLPPARPGFVEIEGSNGYFAISSRCTPAQHDKYVAAFTDSQLIADAARAWPQLGSDAMSMYIGPPLQDEAYSEAFIDLTTSEF